MSLSATFTTNWWEDDNFVRLYDPNHVKGRELYGYLQYVNQGSAKPKLEGKEIVIQGLERPPKDGICE